MEALERQVVYFEFGGSCPFREWTESLNDKRLIAAVDARITRLRSGNFGDSRSIGDGASEYRIHYQSGARIYYGVDGDEIILLFGGDKDKSQNADIKAALANWKIHKERKTSDSK